MQRRGEIALLVDADRRACKGKMYRAGGLALTEWPADDSRPREIYVYAVADTKYFRLDPANLLYCLRWQHRGHPPDFQLQLVTEDRRRIDQAVVTLLAELQRHDPRLAERLEAIGLPF